MIYKISIFAILGYLIQSTTEYWYAPFVIILLVSLFYVKTYKESIIYALSLSVLPWVIKFCVHYYDGYILTMRVSKIFNINSPEILIVLSVMFFAIITIIFSSSVTYIKNIFNANDCATPSVPLATTIA